MNNRHSIPFHIDDHNQLDLLATKFESDTFYEGYTKYYNLLFSPLKNLKINILEIGVLYGHSMKMWKEYFQNGNIYGIDINPNCTQYEEDRIKIFTGDQSDINFLDKIISSINGLDIIIDDGSHMMTHQQTTFNHLFKYIKSSGYYVIEDLHTSYINKFIDTKITTVNYLKDVIDDINLRGKRQPIDTTQLNEYEKTIEGILFFSSICFIKKR